MSGHDPIDFAALAARDAAINAFVGIDRDARAGEGALSGVTVGVKASIMVAGQPWHAGLAAWRDRVAPRDANAVGALRDAGAAIVGVLNLEEGALGAKTDNPHFGATQNPHRAGYSPGGSSGGSGAAVAAGLCDAALGSDTMGSVRIPAAHCGIYGFKPANARISNDGLVPAAPDLDAIGPLARDLAMLERVARVISDFGEAEIAGNGAVLVDHGVAVARPVAAAFERAVAALRAAPADVRLPDPNARIRFAGFIDASCAMAADIGGLPDLSPTLAKLLTYGPRRAEADRAQDRAVLSATKDAVRAIVARHGFLIMPTVPNAPFPHSQADPAAQADFTCLANVAGLPALSLPAGWTDDGLPVAIQLVGGEGNEKGLFALARDLDAKLGAYRAPNPGEL